jgi:hypothetical protein
MEEIDLKDQVEREKVAQGMTVGFMGGVMYGVPLINLLIGIFFLFKTVGAIFTSAKNPVRELGKLACLFIVFFPLCYLGFFVSHNIVLSIILQAVGGIVFTLLVKAAGFNNILE